MHECVESKSLTTSRIHAVELAACTILRRGEVHDIKIMTGTVRSYCCECGETHFQHVRFVWRPQVTHRLSVTYSYTGTDDWKGVCRRKHTFIKLTLPYPSSEKSTVFIGLNSLASSSDVYTQDDAARLCTWLKRLIQVALNED